MCFKLSSRKLSESLSYNTSRISSMWYTTSQTPSNDKNNMVKSDDQNEKKKKENASK